MPASPSDRQGALLTLGLQCVHGSLRVSDPRLRVALLSVHVFSRSRDLLLSRIRLRLQQPATILDASTLSRLGNNRGIRRCLVDQRAVQSR